LNHHNSQVVSAEGAAASSAIPNSESRIPNAAPLSCRARHLQPFKLAFLENVASPACDQQRRYGIPAAVTISQAILESSWGKSILAAKARNYFGIKYSHTQGCENYGEFDVETWEVVNGKRVDGMAEFQIFATEQDCFTRHSLLLMGPRYQAAYAARCDWKKFAERLGPRSSPVDQEHCGYSTNPSYSATIAQLVYEFHLDDRYHLDYYAIGRDPGQVDTGHEGSRAA
jgi:flagellum-specific peptidoglycan hydrolase FlgJ